MVNLRLMNEFVVLVDKLMLLCLKYCLGWLVYHASRKFNVGAL